MSWQERTERQVGAQGIRELREWLGLSETAEARARPGRAHLASLLVLVMAVVVAVLVGPTSDPATAAPLPAGSYHVEVDDRGLTLVVDDTGHLDLTVDDGLVVHLTFDADGRVLDELTVLTPGGPATVRLELAEDGGTDVVTIRPPTTSGGGAADEPQGLAALPDEREDLVATVARCAPRGHEASAAGWPNHGTVVSTAASGLPLTVQVIDPVSGAARTVAADLGTQSGVDALCAAAAALEAMPSLPAGDERRGQDPGQRPTASDDAPHGDDTIDGADAPATDQRGGTGPDGQQRGQPDDHSPSVDRPAEPRARNNGGGGDTAEAPGREQPPATEEPIDPAGGPSSNRSEAATDRGRAPTTEASSPTDG